MAVPKKRQSQSRSRMRRAHDAITAPQLVACSNCGELCLQHRVCSSCGYYDGEKVLSGKKD